MNPPTSYIRFTLFCSIDIIFTNFVGVSSPTSFSTTGFIVNLYSSQKFWFPFPWHVYETGHHQYYDKGCPHTQLLRLCWMCTYSLDFLLHLPTTFTRSKEVQPHPQISIPLIRSHWVYHCLISTSIIILEYKSNYIYLPCMSLSMSTHMGVQLYVCIYQGTRQSNLPDFRYCGIIVPRV